MNPLDTQVVNLAKAIRQTESGGNFNAKGKSGESGGYQWMPETWKAHATVALGNPNAEMTPSNQNAVAYTILKGWKDQGLNPAQIAAKWNSGSEKGWENKRGVNSMGVQYDVPAYVKKVTDTYQQIKGVPLQTPQATQPVERRGMFQSSPNDSALTAGLKTAGNLIPSAYNFVKGAASLLNPLNTAKTLSQIPQAFSELSQQQGGALNALGATVKELPQQAYESIVPEAGRALIAGDTQKAQQLITEDPVGQIAPFLLAGEGVARFADNNLGGLAKAAERNVSTAGRTGLNVMPQRGVYSEAFDTAISKTGKAGMAPIKAVVEAPARLGSAVIKSASSHILGLEPKTISNIIKNPEAFSKIKQDQATRGGLAQEFGSKIDTIETTLQDTGSLYDSIRKIETPAFVPENFIASVLDRFGLKIEQGKVKADTTSRTRNTGDINAVQRVYDNWGEKTSLTPQEYLNFRSDLGDLSRFDLVSGKTKVSDLIGKELYAEANRTVRPQIKGLRELDEQYSPIRQQFDQIKKDFLQKDPEGGYMFKDGAINKIANAARTGKDALLARMENVMPGITKKIEILNSIEDIQRAYGNKVGTYARGFLQGGAILTGNVPAVIAAIITNPGIAVPLLRGLGWTGNKLGAVVGTLKMIAGDINDLKIPDLKAPQIESVNTSIKSNIPLIIDKEKVAR